jgi:hypothetical protein
LKAKYTNWLASTEYDLFSTISLRQGIQRDDGTWQWLTLDDIQNTAWLLRDRYTKALLKKKQKLPFLVFREGEIGTKRFHLHIMMGSTDKMTLREQADLFRFQATKLRWVYHEIDVRSIEPTTTPRLIDYCLKEGTGAFIPEASYIPTTN